MGWDAKSWKGRAIRFPLRLVPADAVVPVVSGPLRGARWVAGSAPHGAWLGTLERRMLVAFAARLHPGMTAWDVGANVGLYTLCASRRVGAGGAVVAFEPVGSNVERLRRNLALNDVANTVVVQRAVCERDGFARMVEGDSASEWRLDETTGTEEVETVALDRWRRSRSAAPPDVVKIDVEGAEVSVLEGALETLEAFHPTVFLSLHGDPQRDQCRRILLALGYDIRPFFRDGRLESTSEWIAELAR